jgi:hypothetical protein
LPGTVEDCTSSTQKVMVPELTTGEMKFNPA